MNKKLSFDVKVSIIVMLLMAIITLIEGIIWLEDNYAKNKSYNKTDYISESELFSSQNQKSEEEISNDQVSSPKNISFPNEKLPLLVEFYAGYPTEPESSKIILNEIQKEYKGKIDVKFIDVSLRSNYELFSQNLIETLPTQIIYNAEGKEIYRNAGIIISTGQIVETLKTLGIL